MLRLATFAFIATSSTSIKHVCSLFIDTGKNMTGTDSPLLINEDPPVSMNEYDSNKRY